MERVGTRLDRYAAAWVAMRTESCEATHIRGDQSEAMLDLRSACLDDRLRHVSDLVEVLEDADAEVVERAVSAVADLPGLEPCTDVVGLGSGLPPPADPEVASATERLRASMGRARALMSAGRFEPARSLALEARSEATALGYAPVLAEADVLLGEVLAELGELEPAAEALSVSRPRAQTRPRHGTTFVRTGLRHYKCSDTATSIVNRRQE